MDNATLEQAYRLLHAFCENEPYAAHVPHMARCLERHNSDVINEVLEQFEEIIHVFENVPASPQNVGELFSMLKATVRRFDSARERAKLRKQHAADTSGVRKVH